MELNYQHDTFKHNGQAYNTRILPDSCIFLSVCYLAAF